METFNVYSWVSGPNDGYQKLVFYGSYKASSMVEVEKIFGNGGLCNGWSIIQLTPASLPTAPQPFPWGIHK